MKTDGLSYSDIYNMLVRFSNIDNRLDVTSVLNRMKKSDVSFCINNGANVYVTTIRKNVDDTFSICSEESYTYNNYFSSNETAAPYKDKQTNNKLLLLNK